VRKVQHHLHHQVAVERERRQDAAKPIDCGRNTLMRNLREPDID
jgi:hypothetical protein